MQQVGYKRNIDKCAWRCMSRPCIGYKKYHSIRLGSFLESFTISLNQCLHLLYLWTRERSQKSAIEDTGVGESVVNKLYTMLKKATHNYCCQNPVQLGGRGLYVQIYESLFRYKPKNHRGRAPDNDIWVFGMIDANNPNPTIFLRIVPNRASRTLWPIIHDVVRPGTVIMTDEWPGYVELSRSEEFNHQTVNHSLHFVDPITGAHTQRIESKWGILKLKVMSMKGVYGTVLHLYLSEWMWRCNVLENNQNAIFDLIKYYS